MIRRQGFDGTPSHLSLEQRKVVTIVSNVLANTGSAAQRGLVFHYHDRALELTINKRAAGCVAAQALLETLMNAFEDNGYRVIEMEDIDYKITVPYVKEPPKRSMLGVYLSAFGVFMLFFAIVVVLERGLF